MYRQNLPPSGRKQEILFIGNAHASWARMAEGFTRVLYPSLNVKSGAPDPRVHAFALLAMLEVGIDITATEIEELDGSPAGESREIIYLAPDRRGFPIIFPNREFTFWPVEPPLTPDLRGFERVRDRIEILVKLFLPPLLNARSPIG